MGRAKTALVFRKWNRERHESSRGAEARYSALRLEGESLVPAEAPLPKVQAEDLAHRVIVSADHALNETNIADCLCQYQTRTPLTIAELWFFPLLLRVTLFESLARLASRVSRAQELRELAYLWPIVLR